MLVLFVGQKTINSYSIAYLKKIHNMQKSQKSAARIRGLLFKGDYLAQKPENAPLSPKRGVLS